MSSLRNLLGELPTRHVFKVAAAYAIVGWLVIEVSTTIAPHLLLPEASNINFAPRIRPPTLLLNGREDEEHSWLTRALPLWNLLSEPKELVLVEGAGHVPPLHERIPAIVDFLDRTLGPVAR